MPAAIARPAPLREGDTLFVIAPSGVFDRDAFESGVRALRARYVVKHRADIFERDAYLAGNDARRIDELREALADDSARAIVAARGGYGATRILDALDVEAIARARKWLVGFSDITALHALWARAGLASVHGPMVATIGKEHETPEGTARFQRWVDVLEACTSMRFEGLSSLRPGRAQGPLLGGNLAVLAALVGTPHLPDLRGAVLFLEDVGERVYRIDRMLTQLHSAGVFSQVAGVAFGQFTDCVAGADGRTVHDVLNERTALLRVPVVGNIPSGHIADNAPLMFGARVRLDAEAGSLVAE